mgnify:CR=1 FL=1
MNNGFIYVGTDKLISILKWLNIIELIKIIVWKASKASTSKRNCNIAIDVFIISKYVLVLLLWAKCVNNICATSIVVYLILSNIFVYFYYHIWKSRISDQDHAKRKFINLITSIAFMIICYGYLYCIPFASQFKWTLIDGHVWFAATRLSISNSFTLSAEVAPITLFSQTLVLSQQVISFGFIAIILSQSIPTKEVP